MATLDLRSDTGSGPWVIDIFEVTYGEVTGDGREDAILRVTCVFADGGNAAAASVAIVSSEPEGLRQVGQPIDGYAPVVIGGRLIVSRSVYGPDDANCCPSGTHHVPVRLDGNQWVDGAPGDVLDTQDVATTEGLGPLRVGATYDDVAAATGQTVLVEDLLQTDGTCVYVSIESLPDVYALGGDGTLHAVEVSHPAVRTRSGLGLGSPAAEVEQAFPGRVHAEPHLYDEGGQYLIFTPADEPNRLVVFETDGSSVTHYRLGESQWARAAEGCA